MDKQMTWLDKANSGKTLEVLVPILYLVNHDLMGNLAKQLENCRIGSLKERYYDIKKALDSGVNPLSFEPINLCYYQNLDLFGITDGRHRITAFYDYKIKNIRAEISCRQWPKGVSPRNDFLF
jgi:hypothetical protein